MNPVDHVSFGHLNNLESRLTTDLLTSFLSYSLTVVVTTSTSVRPLPSPATLPRVRRPVSLPPAELVCSAVPRRPRIKRYVTWSFSCDGLKMDFCNETYVSRRLRIGVPCALSELRLWSPSFLLVEQNQTGDGVGVRGWPHVKAERKSQKRPSGSIEMIHLSNLQSVLCPPCRKRCRPGVESCCFSCSVRPHTELNPARLDHIYFRSLADLCQRSFLIDLVQPPTAPCIFLSVRAQTAGL